MTTPNENELILYTNKDITDTDYKANWDKIIQWLTDGGYDLTVDNINIATDLIVGNNITVTGDITASNYYGNASGLTGLNIQNKNWIINGCGKVDNRNGYYALLIGTYGFGADRWAGMVNGTLVTSGKLLQTTTANIGLTGYGFKFEDVTVTGTGILYFRYRMENKDSLNFTNKKASFSGLVYQDTGAPVNYTIYINKADSVNDFTSVTAISNSGAIIVPNSASTAIKYENIDMGNCGTGIEIIIKAECGAVTLKNFEFTELQFEVGTISTDYEYKLMADEQLGCNRYYESENIFTCGTACASTGAWAGNVSIINYNFKAVKVKTPTVTFDTMRIGGETTYNDYAPYTPDYINITLKSCGFGNNGTADKAYLYEGSIIIDAEL